MAGTTYTLFIDGTAVSAPASRKEYAVNAGEADGRAYEVRTGSGKVVAKGGPEFRELVGSPKTLGEMEPEERDATVQDAVSRLQEELDRTAPALAAVLSEDDQPDEETVLLRVKEYAPGYYWRVLGPDGAKLVQQLFRLDEADVTYRSKDRAVIITGPRAEEAAAKVEAAWRAAMAASATYRRGEEYRSYDLRTRQGRYDSWQLLLVVLRDAMKEALS